jgi:hypothetical protein
MRLIHTQNDLVAEPVGDEVNTECHNEGKGHTCPAPQGAADSYQYDGQEDHQYHCFQHIHELPPLLTIKNTFTAHSPQGKGNMIKLSQKEK